MIHRQIGSALGGIAGALGGGLRRVGGALTGIGRAATGGVSRAARLAGHGLVAASQRATGIARALPRAARPLVQGTLGVVGDIGGAAGKALGAIAPNIIDLGVGIAGGTVGAIVNATRGPAAPFGIAEGEWDFYPANPGGDFGGNMQFAPMALPGGAFTMPAAGGAWGAIGEVLGGALGGYLGQGGEVMGPTIDRPGLFTGGEALFRQTARVTAQRFAVPHPVTGQPVFFGPLGRPLLFSGDLSAARRVSKVARLAARRSGGRRYRKSW